MIWRGIGRCHLQIALRLAAGTCRPGAAPVSQPCPLAVRSDEHVGNARWKARVSYLRQAKGPADRCLRICTHVFRTI